MKNLLLHIAAALAVTAGMIALSTRVNAQQATRDAQDPSAAQQQNDLETQDAKPFNGTIMREKGKLVLKDTAANVSYQLDDQQRAKRFLGKQVRVTGKLDLNTNLIHVESIEVPAS